MSKFFDTLQERVLVCDGAMGTMLYSKGVFINRCFDELNLSSPQLVREVHLDYVRVGADIIETNTFGANRTKLLDHGLADKVREINLAGVRIAREAARDKVFVAGAIGPLGIRVEPWGKTGVDEAREVFREHARALVEGDVDLIILETFSDMNEIHAAILGVRDVTDKPIVAQMTIEDDGNSLEGTPPEVFAKSLDAWGADIIGLNCSVGPQIMLDVIERISNVTSKKLSAQPNAGKPRNVEGRNIYLCSPEYMASYASKFVQHGVRIVGGCCGTTPEHIKAIRTTIKSLAPKSQRVTVAPSATEGQASAQTIPRDDKSRLSSKLIHDEFVKFVEIIPPKGHDCMGAIDGAAVLKDQGVDVVTIHDGPRASARMSALSLAVLIGRTVGIETCVHYSARDRDLLGMQADLLGAYALGLRNILLITGDPSRVRDYADATAVVEVDSIGLTNMVYRLNQGIDVGGKAIGQPTGFLIGVEANPSAINFDEELKRFYYKVEAGAEFVVTPRVFDPALLEHFIRRIENYKIPIIVGIWPLASYKNAEFLNNEVPGCSVPDSILERLRRAGTRGAEKAEGTKIAQETLAEIRGTVQGVQVSAPFQDYETAIEVLSAVGMKGVAR